MSPQEATAADFDENGNLNFANTITNEKNTQLFWVRVAFEGGYSLLKLNNDVRFSLNVKNGCKDDFAITLKKTNPIEIKLHKTNLDYSIA